MVLKNNVFRREELPIILGYGQINQGLSMCRKTLTKQIFEGYDKLNSTTVLDFLLQACMTLAI